MWLDKKSKWSIVCVYFLSLAGFLLFIKGFFPLKPVNGRQSSLEDLPPSPINNKISTQLINEQFEIMQSYDKSNGIPSTYKKLVLMLVDAMTIDFIFGSKHKQHIPFLHSLLKQGHGQSFVSIAKAPTVTMPRIKALTTGSIPAYIDIVLNLESSELKEDNIVNGLNRNGKELLFYGDDTWLKLFPNAFKRKDGVTSFFVKDYTEVDQNVTKHLENELHQNKDWQVMILHYLGLDHIGHLVGPLSDLVPDKLKEMDSVIKNIYSSLQRNELLVLTSDHGMSVGGSHGGTTHPETHTPLLFLSPSIQGDGKLNGLESELEEVEQIDFASTVAVLMGIPIPSNSIGKLIPSVVKVMSDENSLHSFQYNCHHLLNVASMSRNKFPHIFNGEKDSPLSNYRNGVQFHSAFLNPKDFQKREDLYKVASHNYLECSKVVSEDLSSNLASYNYTEMGIGIIALCLGLCGALFLLFTSILQTLHQSIPASRPLSRMLIFMILGSFLHLSSLASSSFVEEEHQTWYFLSVSALLGLCVLSARAVNQTEVEERSPKQVGNSLYDAQIQADSVGIRLRKETASWKLSDNAGAKKKSGNPELISKSPSPKKAPKVGNGAVRMIGLSLFMLISHRVLRGWNQTGVKYAEEPDTEDWLNHPEHKTTLTLLSIVSLSGILFMAEVLCSLFDLLRTLLTTCAIVYVYLYRVQTGCIGFQAGKTEKGIYEARIVYFFLLLMFLKAVYHLIIDHFYGNSQSRACMPQRLCCPKTSTSKLKLFDSIQSFVILLSTLLLRPHNLTPLCLHLCLYWVVCRYVWPVSVELNTRLLTKPWRELTRLDSGYSIGSYHSVGRLVAVLWFGKLAYFNLGNSNGFATIDLSSSYIGLSSSEGVFNTLTSLFLGVFTTYIGEIVWLTLCFSDLIKLTQNDVSETTYQQSPISTVSLVTCTLAATRLVALTVYVAVATGHRYHLFVWSVFAPKLLYEIFSTAIFGWVLSLATLLWQ